MLSSSGRRLDISQPFVDATLPGGHRLHVVLGGITRGFAAVNIRKFIAKAHSLADLVELGHAWIVARPTSSTPRCAPDSTSWCPEAPRRERPPCSIVWPPRSPAPQRLLSVEEVFELKCGHPDWVALQTRQAGLEGTGEITLRALIKEALRMRPSRIIIGEVRAAECLDLLLALNAGLPGMASIHANSARQALVKMCTLPLLAGDNIGSRFVVPTVASSVDLVVTRGSWRRRIPGRSRDRGRDRPGRERHHRVRTGLHPPRRRAPSAITGSRCGATSSNALASTSTRCWEGRDGRSDRLRRSASGCALIAWAWLEPAGDRSRGRDAPPRPVAELLRRRWGGWASRRGSSWASASCCSRWRRS